MGNPDELSREELLLRLIERYVMIGGRYYRDIPAEQQAQYLPDVCESESYRCERLRQLLYEHGAFRGVPFRKGPIEVMDAFIAQGPQRLAAERERQRASAEEDEQMRNRLLARQREREPEIDRTADKHRRLSWLPYESGPEGQILDLVSASVKKLHAVQIAKLLEMEVADVLEGLASLIRSERIIARGDGTFKLADE
ncbi:hypothetical protein [Cupriavidus gilardii]|uniref:Uncharacterized protein n=1 Tax=Cupriavidus gilardii TaxID=82541 RepID=A0ABY4VN04_9BURK|nr:hypothetical protein [Cupriavidus gilardii]MCT9074445.1 hypothetical protein [Cupriavidus gilardii]QKS63602.1 hypothetical protein FOB47_17095 [Cupriavidus gilardii]USE78624.1 hypothetical protein NDR89_18365 [Cupriavidus gilardii]